MSQADSRNNTNPSRRALLAGAPAAALAAGTIGTTLAIATPSSADPIYAVIAQHREVWSEQERTHKIFQKHSDDQYFRPMGITVGEFPETDWKIVDFDGLRQMHEFRTGEMVPIVANTEELIIANAPEDLTGPERAAWIKSKTTELRRRDATERAHIAKTPRSLAYDAWNEACIVAEAVTARLASTRPTTLGGVAAVLAYWSEIASGPTFDPDTDLDSTVAFMETLAEAVREIA